MRILAGSTPSRGKSKRVAGWSIASWTILEDLGFRWALAAIPFVSAHVERLAGDLDAAEHELRNGAEQWRQMGERTSQSYMLGELADVLCDAGRYAEAEAVVHSLELRIPRISRIR